MKDAPKPPDTLSRGSRKLWREILQTWPITDSAHLSILRVALEAKDRADRCRDQINNDGEVVVDRFAQKKPHPLLGPERDSRAQFVNAISKLGLDPSEI